MEAVLTAVCVAIEIGTPVAMGWAWRTRAHLRPRLAVVLGAIAPLLVLQAGVVVAWLADPAGAGRWSMGAVWIVTCVSYLVCLVLGVALAQVRRPRPLAARALLGLAVPAVTAWLLLP